MNCNRCKLQKKLTPTNAYFRDTDKIEEILICTSCGFSVRLSLEENNK